MGGAQLRYGQICNAQHPTYNDSRHYTSLSSISHSADVQDRTAWNMAPRDSQTRNFMKDINNQWQCHRLSSGRGGGKVIELPDQVRWYREHIYTLLMIICRCPAHGVCRTLFCVDWTFLLLGEFLHSAEDMRSFPLR